MRAFIISTLPDKYLATFYSQHPETENTTYDDHLSVLMSDSCCWPGSWAVALRPYGYEISVVIANSYSLQKAWAAEHGVDFHPDSWFADIVMAQVSSGNPDVLIFNNYTAFNAQFISTLRENNPRIRSVIGWCGAPYRNAQVFTAYDLVLSCIPELVDHFRGNGHQSELLPHSFDRRILGAIRENPENLIDFTFVGSIVAKDSFHQTREALLLELISKTNIRVFTDRDIPGIRVVTKAGLSLLAYDFAVEASRLPVLGSRIARLPLIAGILKWGERPHIPKSAHRRILARAGEAVYGKVMFQQLHDSRVSLNSHIDSSPKSASNMRLFEATGVRSCLLTDWKEDLNRYFVPEKEVVTYKTFSECVEKAIYLIDNEKYRTEIARAGQARVLSDHTFDKRAPQIVSYIESTL